VLLVYAASKYSGLYLFTFYGPHVDSVVAFCPAFVARRNTAATATAVAAAAAVADADDDDDDAIVMYTFVRTARDIDIGTVVTSALCVSRTDGQTDGQTALWVR